MDFFAQDYTNADSPFGYHHLLDTFVWHNVLTHYCNEYQMHYVYIFLYNYIYCVCLSARLSVSVCLCVFMYLYVYKAPTVSLLVSPGGYSSCTYLVMRDIAT